MRLIGRLFWIFALGSILWVGSAPNASAVCLPPCGSCAECGTDCDCDGVPDTSDNCLEVPNATQLDADADDFGSLCDCDHDQNGTCGFSDFTIFLSCLGLATGPGVGPADDPNCEESDQDGNGTVGFGDFSLFLGQFGSPPGPACCALKLQTTSTQLVKPGSIIWITGENLNFTGGSTVTIGGITATVLEASQFGLQVLLPDPPGGLPSGTVEVTNDFAGTSTIELGVDNDPPLLTVLSPPDGATFRGPTVTIMGTIIEDNQASVVVNGDTAIVKNDTFKAAFAVVDPTPGAVTVLTILARDEAGNETELTRSVTSAADNDGLPVLTIEGEPASGEPGVSVTFTPSVSPLLSAADYEWDFESDGMIEDSGTGPPVPIGYPYCPNQECTQGVFDALLTVTDGPSGVKYSAARRVLVVPSNDVPGVVLVENLSSPRDIALDRANERLYVLEPGSTRIRWYDMVGNPPYSETGSRTGIGSLGRGIALSPDATNLYFSHVGSSSKGKIQIYDLTSSPAALLQTIDLGNKLPQGLAVNSAGDLYVAIENAGGLVEKYDADGGFITSFGNAELLTPINVAVDGAGNVYVADWDKDMIYIFSEAGELLSSFGAPGNGQGEFQEAFGLSVDPGGTKVAVGDIDTQRKDVQVFSSGGIFERRIPPTNLQSDGSLLKLAKPISTIILDVGQETSILVADQSKNKVFRFDLGDVSVMEPQAVFQGMLDALAAEDIQGALAYFREGSKPKYSQLFNLLKGELPQLVANVQMGTFQHIQTINGGIAEYKVKLFTDADGPPREVWNSIYFTRDEMDQWKLDQF